jgi:excisionase family DNA binding protein
MSVENVAIAGGRETMDKLDPVMTIDEVAEYLDLHPLTVRRLARDGEIPAFSKIPFRGKVGRQWRAKRAILERWLAEESMKNVALSPK